MERRDFLALIASAPIAALAPWPKILTQFNADMSVMPFASTILVTSGERDWIYYEFVPRDPFPVRVLDAWIGWPTKPLEEGMKKLADAIERDYAARHRRFDPARLPT